MVELGLANFDQAGLVRLRANALLILPRRELTGAGEALGKTYVVAEEKQRIEGKIARRIDPQSRRAALIDESREFTLVPWEKTLERQLDKSGSGILRGAWINWQFGRGPSGAEIS